MVIECQVCGSINAREMRNRICAECAWRIATGVVRGEDGRSWAKACAAAANLGAALAEFQNAVDGVGASKGREA